MSRSYSTLTDKAPLSSKHFNQVNRVCFEDEDHYPQSQGQSSIKRRQIRRMEKRAFRRETQSFFNVCR